MSAVHTFQLKHAALAASLCLLGAPAMAQTVTGPVTHNANVEIIGNSDNGTGTAGKTEGVLIQSNGTDKKAFINVTATSDPGDANNLVRGDIVMQATNINITGGTTIAGDFVTQSGTNTLNGATSVKSTLDVTGASTLTGATSLQSTLDVTGASTLNGATSVNNTLTVKGLTNINTTGAADTFIGAEGSTTSLNSNSINVGTGTYATRVNVGSSATGTVVQAQGGDSTLQLQNGSASLTSGSKGYRTYASAQTVGGAGGYALQNGNDASQKLVTSAQVDNIITGNTLVDGNMYINGTLVYSSNTSATTNVVDKVNNTNAAMTIVNRGEKGAVVDANGKIRTGDAQSSTASLTVTNQAGNTHGLVVNESQATMSGGVNSTSMTLNDNGARFSNSATGAPVTVTGVADGRSDFDAVNVRQYAQGIAAVAAGANIPVPQSGNTAGSVGMAVGNYMGKTALAVGGSYRPSASTMIKASIAAGLNGGVSGSRPVVVVGAGWAW